MADSSVAITAGSGTSVDTRTETTNSNHRQVVVLGDPADNDGVAPVDGTAGVKVNLGADNDVVATLSATDNAVLDAIQAAVEVIDNAVSGNEMQVDIVSSALPTGAATAANQSTIAGHVDGIETLLGTIDADTSDIHTNSDTIAAGFATEGSALGSGVLLQGDDGTDRTNVLVDTSGHLQIDVLTVPTTTVQGTVTANLGSTDNAVLDDIAANQTDASQKTQLVDGGGNVIGATANALDVNIASGSSSGTQYDEGDDVETTPTGTLAMMRDGSNAAAPLVGDVTNGLTVNLGSNNDVTVSGVSTAANQSTIIGHVDGIETILGTIDADTGNLPTIETNTDFGTVVGGGTETGALRVTIANNSTGVVSVDDNGGALTVDGTVTANAGTGNFNVNLQDGAGTDITSTGGAIDVNIASGSSSGTEYDDGDADATPTGSVVMGTDGSNVFAVHTDTSGDLQVDVLSSALPTGAATAANQSTIAGHVDGIETLLGTIDADTSILAAVDFATDAKLDSIIADTAAIQTAVEAVQTAVEGTLTVTGGGGGVEYDDGDADATPTGSVAMGTDGSNVFALHTDTSGDLQVDILSAPTLTVNSHAVTNAGTFAVQESGAALTALQLIDDVVYVDDTATHSTGTSKGVGMMAAATPTDTSVSANDIGMVAMATDRRLLTDSNIQQGNADVSISNELYVRGSGTAGTADAAVLSVQGIASMTPVQVSQATHDNLNLNANVQQGNTDVGSGNPLQVTLANTGANATPVVVDLGANNDVTVSGVSTAANQTTIIGHVDGIETLLGTIDTDTGAVSTAATALATEIDTGLGAPSVDSYSHVAINLAAGANQTLVSSAANKQIWVYGVGFVCSAAGSVSFQDEDDTAVTGIMPFAANSGMAINPSGDLKMPIWKLGTDKDLEVDIVTAEVDGWLSYAIVDVS